MARRPDLLAHLRAAVAALDPPLTDIVVAVSGGPDSVALYRGLVEIAPGRVIPANLNHGLRPPQEGHGDYVFVRELSDRLGTDCYTRMLSKDDYPPGNVEAVARKIRYQWLATVAKLEGIDRVATGHTADDQAETVLLRLLRGSGLDGLTGIAPRRRLTDGVELVRPLLAVSRADVVAYLASIGQEYRTDATNADTRLARNRVRHELLPLLARDYNPRAAAHLARLADEAREWSAERAEFVESALAACERPRAGAVCVFDRAALADAKPGLLRALWRHVWQREGWPRDGMGFREYDAVAGLCRGVATALDLPGEIRLRVVAAVVQAGPITQFEGRV